MTTLHIKAVSGPRPVTAAAVRDLLSRGRIDAQSQVLSLDSGLTWMAVADALAVVDRLAVADHDVDTALASGRNLHPIAMPLGGVAIALLVAGIGLGGGPAAGAITSTPVAAATAAGALASAGADSLTAAGHATVRLAALGWSACLTAGCQSAEALPQQASAPAPAAETPSAESPAAGIAVTVASSDLERSWHTLIADRSSSTEAWQSHADALAGQTRTAGIAGWSASITQTEPFAASMRDTFPKAGKAQRFVELQTAQDGGSLLLLLSVEGTELTKAVDDATSAQRRIRISADIESVSYEAPTRNVVLIGYLRELAE